tara:strand:+ start:158 stop:481 length:324 start_codon:yes stop_codon:yes gene_type:complete
MDIEFTDNKELESGETSKEAVQADTEMKNWLVNYVGEKTEPENGDVTVEMIVETMATEFPEFLMAVAEENWVRGYHQALEDVTEGERIAREEASTDTSELSETETSD